jgi:hypothetical protein
VLAALPLAASADPGPAPTTSQTSPFVIGVDDDHAKWLARPDGLVAKYRDLGLEAVRLTNPWRRGQRRPTNVGVCLHRAAMLIERGQRRDGSTPVRRPTRAVPPVAPDDAEPWVRDQAGQLRDALLLARCQPAVGAFFNFELLDEDRLAGWQSGVLWRDGTEKPSYGAFRDAVALVRSERLDCATVPGVAGAPLPPAKPHAPGPGIA